MRKPSDYAQLLDGLDESGDRLRIISVRDEQRNLELAQAFYCIEDAAAAIRTLLNQTRA